MQHLLVIFFLSFFQVHAMHNEHTLDLEKKIIAHHVKNLYQPLPIASETLPGKISSINWQPNGNQIAITTEQSSAFSLLENNEDSLLWNNRSFFGKQGTIGPVAWHPDGNNIIAAFENDNPSTWTLSSQHDELYNVFPTRQINTQDSIDNFVFSPNGKQFATVSHKKNSVKIWNTENDEFIASVRGLNNIICAEWNEKYVILCNNEGRYYIFEEKNNLLTFIKSIVGAQTALIASSPDNESFVVAHNKDLVLYQITSEASKKIGDHNDTITHIKWNHQNNIIATATQNGVVNVWNPANNSRIGRFNLNEKADIDFNYEGTRLISGSVNGNIKLWDIERMALVNENPYYSLSTKQQELLKKVFKNGPLVINPKKDKQVVDSFNSLPKDMQQILRIHNLVREKDNYSVLQLIINKLLKGIVHLD